MNFRERVMAIFRHEPVDNVVYQPRIEHWYNVNKHQGTLPDRYKNMSLLDVYDDLGCSIRSYGWYNGCLKYNEDPKATFESIMDGNRQIAKWTTPVGSIETHYTHTDRARHTEKFPVQTRDDAKVMEYMLRGRTAWFDMELFKKNDAEIGNRAAPMMFIPRVNLQKLFIEIMGYESTIYAWYDDPEMVESLIKAVDESEEQMLDVVAESPIPIINFGDNVDHHFLTPELYEKYVEPAYHRRVEKLKKAGKFTHAHWDGNIKNLLPYAKRSGMDGIEALTPVPQGDITVEEMKEALGDDLILLDGIPMTCFLPHEPIEELERYTRQIIELFAPNLILGVSDEPSPVCDIERVRLAGEIMNEYEGKLEARV